MSKKNKYINVPNDVKKEFLLSIADEFINDCYFDNEIEKLNAINEFKDNIEDWINNPGLKELDCDIKEIIHDKSTKIDDHIKDEYLITTYKVNFNNTSLIYLSSAYIKDQCICDEEYDFDFKMLVNNDNNKKKSLKKKIKKYKNKIKKFTIKLDELNDVKYIHRNLIKLKGKNYIKAIKYILDNENILELENEDVFFINMVKTLNDKNFNESEYIKQAFKILIYHSDILEEKINGETFIEYRTAEIGGRHFQFKIYKDDKDDEIDFNKINYNLKEWKKGAV